MIKINLVREGRAVRGAGAAPAAAAAVAVPGGPTNLNNLIIIGLVAVSVVVAAGYWFINNRLLASREKTVAERKAEADKLESIIKEVEDFQKRKDSLQNRIDLINQLKQNQKGPVRIMDQISRDLPDLVWLDKMTVAGGRITLNGRGLNPNAIANYVENIKNDPYFEEPELGTVTEVVGMSKTPVYSFDMGFNFTYAPKTPGAPAGTPGATGTSGTTSTTGTAKPAAGAAR
ncbi:MAG TPA: PilN domain-containing protein [Thermoanaerobaculia bacterium]|nr:PilN domain-containing protein [Thermoanaerobaculia bacterium]